MTAWPLLVLALGVGEGDLPLREGRGEADRPAPLSGRILSPDSKGEPVEKPGGRHADAIRYIARALQENPIVCLGEDDHASKTSHQFIGNLLRDPEVQAALDVLIVEFATYRHQALLDDYISGGEVTHRELSRVWRDTTLPPLTPWDSPLYYELLELVREINQSLTPDKRIRVLGGDPPIKWEEIQSMEDHRKYFSQRNSFPGRLAVEQAFHLDKRVLVLFGAAHLPKAPNEIRGKVRHSITSRIEMEHPGSVEAISFLIPEHLGVEERIPELERGKIYETHSHWVGEVPGERVFPGIFYRDGSGRATLYKGCQVKDLFDALIYIGPGREWETMPAPPQAYDEEYRAELNRRSMIL